MREVRGRQRRGDSARCLALFCQVLSCHALSCAQSAVPMLMMQRSRACPLSHHVPSSHLPFPLACLACRFFCALTAVCVPWPVTARHAWFQGASREETRPHDQSHHMTGQHGTERGDRTGQAMSRQDRTVPLARTRQDFQGLSTWLLESCCVQDVNRMVSFNCSDFGPIPLSNSLCVNTVLRQCTSMVRTGSVVSGLLKIRRRRMICYSYTAFLGNTMLDLSPLGRCYRYRRYQSHFK